MDMNGLTYSSYHSLKVMGNFIQNLIALKSSCCHSAKAGVYLITFQNDFMDTFMSEHVE